MECRICLDDCEQNDMISPCLCRGTSKYVHRKCLNQWMISNTNQNAGSKCQECNFEYIKETTSIPIEWFLNL